MTDYYPDSETAVTEEIKQTVPGNATVRKMEPTDPAALITEEDGEEQVWNVHFTVNGTKEIRAVETVQTEEGWMAEVLE